MYPLPPAEVNIKHVSAVPQCNGAPVVVSFHIFPTKHSYHGMSLTRSTIKVTTRRVRSFISRNSTGRARSATDGAAIEEVIGRVGSLGRFRRLEALDDGGEGRGFGGGPGGGPFEGGGGSERGGGEDREEGEADHGGGGFGEGEREREEEGGRVFGASSLVR